MSMADIVQHVSIPSEVATPTRDLVLMITSSLYAIERILGPAAQAMTIAEAYSLFTNAVATDDATG